jgi:hypothetical protein
MVNYTEDFNSIERDFLAHGIPIDSPAFYDHPAFIAMEATNASYLGNYARYVHDRTRTSKYDKHVLKTVPIVASVYYDKLKKNGRLGACVDISGVISRALEREGIWNFIVKGSLTITFPIASGIRPRYFWSVDTNQFTAAHAWVAAPPFFVVDVAVRLQPYAGKEANFLPDIICDEAKTLGEATLNDIVAPEILGILSARGIPKQQQLQSVSPATPAFVATFPTREINFQDTTLKYVPVAATAPDGPFENMKVLSFDGKSGYEVYVNDVRTALNESNNT